MIFFLLQLINLLRNVLDRHALTLQSAQLLRPRIYNDKLYNITVRHPRSVPNWAYNRQNTSHETDVSEVETNEDDNVEEPQTEPPTDLPVDENVIDDDFDSNEAESSTAGAKRKG